MIHGNTEPRKIVDIKDGITFNQDDIESVIQNVKNKKVAVVSIVGEFRSGKSFLLSYLAKALESQTLDDDTPLEGPFESQAGTERLTRGIDMCREAINVTLQGEKICVLLMDTQGAFDNKSTFEESSSIFAMATLLSSTFIYNINKRIKETDIEHLQTWLEFGIIAAEKFNTKPFQELLFIVRDWEDDYEYKFGPQGGKEYIDEFLQTSGNQAEQFRILRTRIKECFQKISCVLLPHPNFKTKKNLFTGKLKDVSEDFKIHLKDLLQTFQSEHIHIKEANEENEGRKLRCKDIPVYFKAYGKMLREDGNLPRHQCLTMANANAYNMMLAARCLEDYTFQMKTELQGTVGSSKYVKPQTLFDAHNTNERRVYEMFDFKCSKFLSPANEKSKLQEDIANRFDSIKKENEKNIAWYDTRLAKVAGTGLGIGTGVGILASALLRR